MVTLLPGVALLLLLCTLGWCFQTILGSCLQTVLGTEKGRLSKHRKQQQA